ncbi:uncharacterized protein LOC142986535 [Anticarsia gemmatalis]|uniref:uncharacterized protein LOC142986535 n=1 Tax=Anticarsia gemmatalis TaxID=129554 RepID=UPI003F760FAA
MATVINITRRSPHPEDEGTEEFVLTESERSVLLVLRMTCVILLVIMLTIHLRSLRVFRWEQSVSGGVLVTYSVAMIGLVFCAGIEKCGCRALQAYLCSTGAALMVANCAAIWYRWRSANELTRAVAELLSTLGVPLRRQVLLKVCLSAATAICLLLDLSLLPIFFFIGRGRT